MHKTGPKPEFVDPQELFDVVSATVSQDHTRLQPSTHRLKELLELPGTDDALHEIAAHRNFPLQVRQQSIIQFKNAALARWKSRKYNSDEQRGRIRARCLTFLDEEDDVIAECNKVIIAKIARQDYPDKWNSLTADLMGIIESNLQVYFSGENAEPRVILVLRRSLQVLNELLKEFSSAKMLIGVAKMSQLVEQVHSLLYSYYFKISSSIISNLNNSTLNQLRTAESLTLANLVFKCLHKLGTWIWNRNTHEGRVSLEGLKSWVEELFVNSASQLKTFLDIRITLITALRSNLAISGEMTTRSLQQLTKHVRLLGKFFRRLQQLSASRFVLLQGSGDLIIYYWNKVVQATQSPPEFIADTEDAVFPVRFLVQAMVLFKDSLAQWTPLRRNGLPNENTLSQTFVEDAVRLLVTRFIPLNPADLEKWMANPEEWVNTEGKDDDLWEFELRPCAERVLMTLSNQYRDYVIPLLEMTFNQVAVQPATDLSSIIQKEAVYCSIGRCATRLKDVIPFDRWLEHTLIVEAQETNSNYPIIKRRIAWLLGKWISEDCSSPNNPKLWDILVYLLRGRGSGTDAVVRLTAATALRDCVDSIQFDPDVFAPFLASAVPELLVLIAEADTLESQIRILDSLNTVIEQTGIRIVPFMAAITEHLPQIWTSAGQEWLLKSRLLTTVTKLVESSKENSISLTSFVAPLVRESLSPGAIDSLDDGGLSLWLAALRNCPNIQGASGHSLIELFPYVVQLLTSNADLLGKIVSIHESYFLLNASEILQSFAVDDFNAFRGALINQAGSTNTNDMLLSLNMLFQISPPLLWGEALHISGLFVHFVKTFIDTSNPLSTTLLTEYMFVLARIAVADRQMFLQLMSATAQKLNVPETSLYEGLLDRWWEKFDNVSEPHNRKLVAMGIASLVATGKSEVLQRLPTEIFNIWMDVFGEIKETQALTSDGSSSPLQRHWERDEPPASYFKNTEGTLEYDRRRLLFEQDPVRTVQLSSYLSALLQEAEVTCGPPIFKSYLDKADPLVLKQMQNELLGA